MVLVATYFSTKKQCIITKYSNDKAYDVNSLYLKYLSKKNVLVENKYFAILKATHLQELESEYNKLCFLELRLYQQSFSYSFSLSSMIEIKYKISSIKDEHDYEFTKFVVLFRCW